MRAREFAAEALKPSQYRRLVKGWDSSRLADIFQQWPGEKNRTATRLYIDLPATQTVTPPNPQVSNKLQQLGYEVVDYTRGLARKKDGNQNPTKIGKILSAAVQKGDDEANTALQQFQNDPKRGATRAEYQGVISRHPYDIAGMSTDRGWTSCQDLVGGSRCQYVPRDIKAGTLVAYMIKKDDVDIKAPVGRILLKPYINDKNQTAYAPHTETYGTVTKEFEKAVSQFAVWINKQTGVTGLFKINPKVYFNHGKFDDNDSYINVVAPDASRPELIKILKKNSNHIKHILDAGIRPDEDLQRLAVSNNGDAIKYIVDAGIEPSKAVQLAAVRDLSSIIEHIVNAGIQPDKEVQIAAVNRNPSNIRYLVKAGIQPDEEVQIAAVSGSDNGINIRYIIDAGITPSEDVQIAAVRGGLLSPAIYFITNAGIELSERVQLAAMKENAWMNIRYIIKAGVRPSERVQLAAVDNDGDAIENIIDAGIEPSKAVVEKAKENGWRGEYKK